MGIKFQLHGGVRSEGSLTYGDKNDLTLGGGDTVQYTVFDYRNVHLKHI